ncbi:zinc finger protein 260-like isoform X1 [Diabrotica virgifera virgifera]|uniref:Uncharacterized protein n=2 Tax=Diabrotica virgifera virgifera TaxID=50390 RepID=A0ABM5JVB9_DIAVI|nr:zinc finger protein 260-like isoform X1 [Diabrotica virgifera virgifera]
MSTEFNELCRVCLNKKDGMKYLLKLTHDISEVLSMLSSIISFEVNMLDGFPSYICVNCEEKLRISYDFQQTAIKSQQIIKEYVDNKLLSVEFPINNEVKEENCAPEVIEDISIIFENDSSSSSEDDSQETLKKEEKKAKLSQHDPEEIMSIVNETRLKFYEAKECLLCSFTGINNRTLSLHMTKNHGDIKEKWCRKCNKIEENLSEHIKTVHRDELKCSFCGKKCRSSTHLVEHLLCHSANPQFTCLTCQKNFISERQLKSHTKIHKVTCEVCSKTFEDKHSILAHTKLHNMLRCTICNDTFGQKEYDKHNCSMKELKNEKQSDILLDRFCLQCNESVEDINNHIKTHHNVEDSVKGLCTFCGKQFKNQSYLSVHLRRHTKETPYKCNFCNVATVTKAHLQEHERTHTGEKPYTCNFCGKAFIQRSVLSTHLKIHTGRTEQCQLCPKKFCRPSELRNHMRKHTGEKPYACTYCHRPFIQKSHLTEHLKTHTDDRPFKCHICDKAFKQSGTLKSHINIHEGKNIYKCDMCPYTCRKNYTLTLHMRQHQANNSDPVKCDGCEEVFPNEETLTEHRHGCTMVCDDDKATLYDEYLNV